MTIAVVATVFESAIFTPRDLRDPLGIWAARATVVGDASGGIAQVNVQVPGPRRAGHVYNCIAAEMIGEDPTTASSWTVRLLTNWPISDSPGIQGADMHIHGTIGSFGTGSNKSGVNQSLVPLQEIAKSVFLFDPQPDPATPITLLEIWTSANTLAEERTGTAYGWYWDRQVFLVPGGPRFPGMG